MDLIEKSYAVELQGWHQNDVVLLGHTVNQSSLFVCFFYFDFLFPLFDRHSKLRDN